MRSLSHFDWPFLGNGVRHGVKVEALYREMRALRIYEGATEVQKHIIADDLLKAYAKAETAGDARNSQQA